MISEAEAFAVRDAGHADVFLTQDAPDRLYVSDAIRDMLDHNPQGWSSRALEYARLGRDRLTVAFEGVTPLIHFHGHYHVKGSRPATRFREPTTR